MKYTAPYFSLHDTDQFESPFDVIQHYLNGDIFKDNGGGTVHLITPLVHENTIKSRWYHGDILPDVVEMLLNDKGQDGSFLVRASYKSPGDYALCVRVKDEIINVKIHGKGKKFDLGAGKQFDSVEDLIEYYRKYPFSVSGGTQVVLYQEMECEPNFDPVGGACLSRNKTFPRYLIPVFSQENVWKKYKRYLLTIDGATVPLIHPQVRVKGGMIKAEPDGTIDTRGNPNELECQFQFWLLRNHPSRNIFCIQSCAYQDLYWHWGNVGEQIRLLKINDDHERDVALRIRWVLIQDPEDHKKNLLQAWDEIHQRSSPKYLVFNSLETEKVKPDRYGKENSYTIVAFLYSSLTYAKQNAAITKREIHSP
ncbi:uncharacterized protein [Dysidea avara]